MQTTAPAIKCIKPHGNKPLVLHVIWEDDTGGYVDMSGIIYRTKRLEKLKDPNTFEHVTKTPAGGKLRWPYDICYRARDLYKLWDAQRTMTAEEFIQWQKRMNLMAHETAHILQRHVDR